MSILELTAIKRDPTSILLLHSKRPFGDRSLFAQTPSGTLPCCLFLHPRTAERRSSPLPAVDVNQERTMGNALTRRVVLP